MRNPFDEPTADDLRAAGSLKWTRHPGAVGAWVAESDFGTAPVVTRAVQDAVAGGLLGYLPDGLAARMSAATAGWLAERHGWSVEDERVRPLGDVIAAVQAAITHFSDPDGVVVVPTPAYMPFLTVPPGMGRRVVEVPLARDGDRWVHDLDALDAAFASSPGRPLLLLCNPHNPVGRVLEVAELAAISEVVDRHGARVLADEIHAPLVLGGRRHVSYAALSEVAAAHTVTAVSASKAFNLAGLKCAQLVLSNDADAARWAEVGVEAEHGASTLGVVAAVAAYEEGGPWLDGLLAHLDGHRRRLIELVAEHLPGVRMSELEGTYLAWLDLRALDLPGSPAALLADRAGVVTVDGAQCGAAGAGFVRYNLATPRGVMEQSLAAMGRALGRLGDGGPTG